MEPLTALAMLASLGGTAATIGNNNNAMATAAANLQYQQQKDAANLAFQKSQAAKEEAAAAENTAYSRQQAQNIQHFNEASKTDAYGDTVRYDPATNSWITDLTPQQKQNISAGEQEQLRSLTTDANQNRQARARQNQSSLDAVLPMQQAISNYENNKVPSEDGINGKLVNLMLAANQDKAKAQQDTLTRQALRTGHADNIPLIANISNNSAVDSTGDVMLNARKQAMQEFLTRSQAHDAQYLPEISKFQNLIDDAGQNAPQNYSSTPQSTSNTQAQSANILAGSASALMQPNNSMLTALNNAAGGVNNALNSSGVNTASTQLSTIANNKIDMNGLAKILAEAGKTSAKNSTQSPNALGFETDPNLQGINNTDTMVF